MTAPAMPESPAVDAREPRETDRQNRTRRYHRLLRAWHLAHTWRSRALLGLSRWWRADVVVQRVLLAFSLFQLAAMLWDQPGFYGWENDGAAPRDFFGGIAQNLTPGAAHRYPLLHAVLIGVCNLPVLVLDLLVALVTGAPLGDVVTSVTSMTAIALVTKLLHVVMLAVALLAQAQIFRALFGERAARWGVLLSVANLSVAYYGRVTNVDVAYILWVALAVERLLAWVRAHDAACVAAAAGYAAAAVATKDQAYASLLGPMLLCLGSIAGMRRTHTACAPSLGAQLGRALGGGALAYVVLSGAIFNPTGFVHRLELLAGSNSQDWRQYAPTLHGVGENIVDLFFLQDDFWWPWPVVLAAWAGALSAPLLQRLTQPGARRDAARWSLCWLPLSAGLSATLAFTLLVGRAEHRFMLPLGFWLGGYAGVGVAALATRVPRAGELAVGGLLFALGFAQSLELVVTEWCDSRRAVERFLSTLAPGSQVETYGLGVYLPRFALERDAPYRVTRVSHLDWSAPAPIAGITDVKADLAALEQRKPDVLVLPEGFASRFQAARGPGSERRAMAAFSAAPGASAFFERLMTDQTPGYRLLDVGELRLPRWYGALGGRALSVHGSTGRRVWVLGRTPSGSPAPAP
jgi:hypothetical protein